MVDINVHRYFDPRFLQFGITALVLKFIVYYIQSQLNRNMNYTVPDTVVIRKGNSSATIHLFGATLTSWIADGQEVLFVSKDSLFDGKKAIRGGIPVVFPQFGPWKDGPQHGIARINMWTVKDDYSIDSELVTLVLEDNDSTRKFWDHRFRFEYTITLTGDKQMKMDAVIVNTGDDSFSFTFLLHTYFSVPDVLFCKINGLSGCTYIDKVRGGETFTEKRSDVTVSEFTDRIYINTPAVQKVKNISGKRTVIIEKMNLPDTVVWNPWMENAKSMSDFGDDEWRNMLCIEAGVVNKPITLNSKESFAASQIFSILEKYLVVPSHL